MNATNRTLDRLAAKFRIPSDYGLAKLLDVTRGAVSSWRTGKSGMADAVALRAAQLLDEDAEELLALLQADRATNEETRKVWRHIAGRLRRSAAVIAVGIAGLVGVSQPTTVRAAEMTVQQSILR